CCRGNTAAHPIDAIDALSLVSLSPAEQHVAVRAIQREAVFPRDRRVLVCQPLDPPDIVGEDGGDRGEPQGNGKRISMAEVTGVQKRSIGGPLRLTGIAVMP